MERCYFQGCRKSIVIIVGVVGKNARGGLVEDRVFSHNIVVGKGRRAAKIQLSERFEQAIDRCAMKVGARDTDSYLAEWRKAPLGEVEGEPEAIAATEAARLEAEFDTAALKRLIDAEGWAKA